MKTRESGMPDQTVWQTFFSPTETLLALGLRSDMSGIVDFGCGYGTFTIPAAQITKGIVHGFDIEPGMIAATRDQAERNNLTNIRLHQRDFVTDGTGLPNECMDCAMLFNILHAEQPDILLAEAFRILRFGGILAVMHWNYDPNTPRGPAMSIRPQPQQCAAWAENAGFVVINRLVDLPPFHYGIVTKKETK